MRRGKGEWERSKGFSRGLFLRTGMGSRRQGEMMEWKGTRKGREMERKNRSPFGKWMIVWRLQVVSKLNWPTS